MEVNQENIRAIFQNMSANGFDLENELKWGFFFTASKKSDLVRLFDELKDHNYILEEISREDHGQFQLHVSKQEILSAEKLHRRNIAFNELAEICNVDLYDGWDVGKIS